MRKAMLKVAVILGATVAFTASAAEMVRYDYDRYDDRNNNSEYGDTHKAHGHSSNTHDAYKTNYRSEADTNKHPIFQKNGLMQDR